MKCYYCDETITKEYHDTEGNTICRKCNAYYSKCSKCRVTWHADRLIRGMCEECLEKGEEECEN